MEQSPFWKNSTYSANQKSPLLLRNFEVYQWPQKLPLHANLRQINTTHPIYLIYISITKWGHVIAKLVEALYHKQEGCRFDPYMVILFLNWPNPSSCAMALGSTQPLTEMGTRSLPGGKGQLTCKADNFTTICKLTVYKMWESPHFTTSLAFTAYYWDSFTFFL
jgi:hypothetical protein